MERENGAQDGPAAAGRGGEASGEARVDEVVGRLDRLAGLPLDEHVTLFEDTHDQLREVLSDLDAGRPGGQAGARPDAQAGR